MSGIFLLCKRSRQFAYDVRMAGMLISEVARQVGLRASAIRYYEQIGILTPAERSSGQRHYDKSVLYRLALIQLARQSGFTLEEIRQLFFGFREGTPISQRWQKLSRKKLAELDAQVKQIDEMRALLHRIQTNCQCDAIEQCGKGIFESQSGDRAIG